MRRLVAIIIAAIYLYNICVAAGISKKMADDALDMLDTELASRDTYIARRQHTIDSLKILVDNPRLDDRHTLALRTRLGDAYCSFRNDSAIWNYREAARIADKINDKQARAYLDLRTATYLPLLGLNDDAISLFNSVDRTLLADSLVQIYHDAGGQMYSYIASSYSQSPDRADYYNSLVAAHRDTILQLIPEEDPRFALIFGEKLMREGKDSHASVVLGRVIETIGRDSNIYARACHMLATIALRAGDIDAAKYYLAGSAAADIRGAVLEVMSLQELGVMLSESGDINRAYDYLSVALENAVECHAIMRIVESSEALPLIQQTHQRQTNASRRLVLWSIVALCVILAILSAVLLMLRRQMKRMHTLQQDLRNANGVKDVYISQFFRLCSIYIDRLNRFVDLANRKISAGKVDELYKLTKSGKIIEEHNEEFYHIFDDAFLHIYPTFVEDVNKLLADKIELKEGQLLNNELRILAFMRLGLDDTTKVAAILNYSVNTIYTYRNKLRNRAIDRENFERDIMRICAL